MDPDLNDSSVIARNLYPAAFDPDELWSGEVWDRRRLARVAAQKALRDRPEWAQAVLAEYRGFKSQSPDTDAARSRRASRNAEIGERRKQGAARQELADAYGLSIHAIDAILRPTLKR